MADVDLASLTAAQWTDAILRALKAHDIKGVSALVHGMALYHPNEAEEIRQMLLLGIAIKTRPSGDTADGGQR